jgi:hypothetical protein
MGAAILKTLDQNEEAELYRLKVDNLAAVLTHAYPREHVSKPKSKAKGQERFRALASVKDSLERQVLAVEVVGAPEPTSLAAPLLENADAFQCQSVGSVGSFNHVPVLPVFFIEDVVL